MQITYKDKSTVVCTACFQFLIDAYTFRLKCLESNNLFINNVQNNEEMDQSHSNLQIDGQPIEIKHVSVIEISDDDFSDTNSQFENEDDVNSNNTDEDYFDDEEDDIDDKDEDPNVILNETDLKIDDLFLKMKSTKFKMDKIVCEFCNRPFASIRGLRYHIETHRIATKYKCKICNALFRTHMQCLRHKRIHRKNIFKCSECPQVYPVVNLLVKHLKRHHMPDLAIKDDQLPCGQCEEVFMHPAFLNVGNQLFIANYELFSFIFIFTASY